MIIKPFDSPYFDVSFPLFIAPVGYFKLALSQQSINPLGCFYPLLNLTNYGFVILQNFAISNFNSYIMLSYYKVIKMKQLCIGKLL